MLLTLLTWPQARGGDSRRRGRSEQQQHVECLTDVCMQPQTYAHDLLCPRALERAACYQSH